jgi:hypothetical protein
MLYILTRKHQKKRLFRKFKRKYEDSSTMSIKGTGFGKADWIHLALDMSLCSAVVYRITKFQIL